MNDALLAIVLERIEHAGLDQDIELQVLAACEGLLHDLLDDGDYDPPTAETVADAEPPGVYLGISPSRASAGSVSAGRCH